MRHPRPTALPRRQTGLSLIELMISIGLGLVVLAAITTAFINNSRTRTEIEKTSQQIENGRYAMQLLSDDLRSAGFYAEYTPPTALPATFTTTPDPCATTITTIADLTQPAFLLHVQGNDNGTTVPTCLSTAGVKPNTDILVVRRVSTCIAGTANCDVAANGTPYFQASLCTPPVAGGTAAAGTELSSTNALCPLCSDYFALDSTLANLTKHFKDCKTTANLRRFRTHIYFIAANDNTGDGIPTLKRAELGAGGFTVVPLVEGIENLQLEYGIDTGPATGVDGVPEVYSANPETYAPASVPPNCTANGPVCNWWNVVSVNIHLLARNTQTSTGYTDTKVYTLGLDAAGNDNTVGPFNDGFRRHAYEAVVRLTNPSARKQ